MKIITEAIKVSNNPVISYSGGKDSEVVLHLVRSIKSETPALFNNTGVEMKETIKHVKTINNLMTVKPETTFWKCVDKYGLPQVKTKAKSHGNRCCFYLKEKPAMEYYKKNKIDLCFTGLTADESHNRWMFFKRLGSYYYSKTWKLFKCHPIWNWSESEVWQYIRDNNIPYNKAYDPPRCAKRCGCEPCTAYLSWKKRLAHENFKMLKVILKLQGQSQLEFDCKGEIK